MTLDRSKYQRPAKTLFKRIITPKLRRKMRYPFGLFTCKMRQLPGAVVIGVQKGGTSSMYRTLQQHPQFRGAINKEVHFFDYRYDKGMPWYQAMFPLKFSLPKGCVTGEATPFYMYHPLVAARLADSLPDAKFIVLLRNPVDRAISHYYHNVRRGREERSILEAFDSEADMIAEEKARLEAKEIFKPYNYRHFSYTERGLYAEQLERWFEHFPREQFFIEQSERFYSGTENFFKELFTFLEIDPDFVIPDLTPGNVGMVRGENHDMVDRLTKFFEPHNQKLEALLGKSYGWSGQAPLRALE